MEILSSLFGKDYQIDSKVVDSSDYGVPQTRLRAIIKLWPKTECWPWPEANKHKITVREAIGDIPSLEAGQKSTIKWHFARNHTANHILWMKHTATGTSAFSNPVYYPKKADGTKIKGYQSFLMCLGTIFIILIGFKVVNLIKRFIKLKNNL